MSLSDITDYQTTRNNARKIALFPVTDAILDLIIHGLLVVIEHVASSVSIFQREQPRPKPVTLRTRSNN
jgi:hypothetical protein